MGKLLREKIETVIVKLWGENVAQFFYLEVVGSASLNKTNRFMEKVQFQVTS